MVLHSGGQSGGASRWRVWSCSLRSRLVHILCGLHLTPVYCVTKHITHVALTGNKMFRRLKLFCCQIEIRNLWHALELCHCTGAPGRQEKYNVTYCIHVLLCYVTSCHIVSCHITSCHITSCHIMSWHKCNVSYCTVNCTGGIVCQANLMSSVRWESHWLSCHSNEPPEGARQPQRRPSVFTFLRICWYRPPWALGNARLCAPSCMAITDCSDS